MTLSALLPVKPMFSGDPDSMVTIPASSHPPTVDLRRWLSLFLKSGIW